MHKIVTPLLLLLIAVTFLSVAGFERVATATTTTPDDQWGRFIELFGYQSSLLASTTASTTPVTATTTATTTNPRLVPQIGTATSTVINRPPVNQPSRPSQNNQQQDAGGSSMMQMGMELLKQFFSSLVAEIPSMGGIPEPTHEGTPFGGMIVARIECTCSGNYLIIVNDTYSMSPKNILVAPPQSRLYQFYVFNPGQTAVGTYTPGPMCLIVTATGCAAVQTDGQINAGPGAGSSGPYEVEYADPKEGAPVSNTGNPNEIQVTGEAGTVTPNRVAINTDGINPPPFSDPDYQAQTSYLNGRLDANVHNYVVVPINSNIPNGTPVRLTNTVTGQTINAFVADRGPNANGLGEMSLAAARNLGAWTPGMGNAALQHSIQWEFFLNAPRVTAP